MPKYWGGNYFAHGRFPKVGQKQKTEKKKKRRERLNDGNNNGQATHGACKHPWRTHGARMAHALRTHGARMAHASRLGQNNIMSLTLLIKILCIYFSTLK